MCKGAGMIMPNMATMIAVITTDVPIAALREGRKAQVLADDARRGHEHLVGRAVPIAAPDLSQALTAAVNKSFNKVTVDSDTS